MSHYSVCHSGRYEMIDKNADKLFKKTGRLTHTVDRQFQKNSFDWFMLLEFTKR
jgi:hypothetical protein